MKLLLNLDEAAERKFINLLTDLLLQRAFGDSTCFSHAFMSYGETVGRFFAHVTEVRFEGPTVTLNQPPHKVLKNLDTLPLSALPLLVDTLDVVFTYFRHVGGVPNQIRLDRYAAFDPQIAEILFDMELLSRQSYLSGPLQLMMVNHYDTSFGFEMKD